MGTQPLPKKGRSPPIFGPRQLWLNGCMDQDATCMEVGLARHYVKWGPSSPSSKRDFGQCPLWLNGWMIKMPLGTEGNVGQGDVVLDGGRSSLPLKTAQPPVFGSSLLWPNGWMDEDVTWYGSILRPRRHCIRRSPSSPRKGHSSPPLFGPCLLWPRSPISATAELLFYFKNCFLKF